jgi:hypothetical protein
MSWITTKLLGIRQLLSAASPLPQRPNINFVAGATVADNPVTNATDVTIDASTVFTTATNLATPDTICKRSPSGSANFAGTSHFVDVQATAGVTAATCTTSGNATVGGKLTVTGQGIVGGTLSVTGATSCAALTTTSITCSGNASVAGTLSCGALTPTSIHTSADVEVGTNLVVDGTCSVSGAVAMFSNVSISGATSVGSLTSGADVTVAPGSSFKLGATRTYTLAIGAAPHIDLSLWTRPAGQTKYTSVGTGSQLFVPLDALPPGAILTSVSVWTQSVGVHASLPVVKRSVEVVYKVSSTGAETATWTTSDPSGTVAAYDAWHSIVATGTPLNLNRAITTLYVHFIDESSTNSLNSNTKFSHVDITYTLDRVVGT